MDDIARLAGVSKQTIYLHFEDKERLLFSVLTEIMSDASRPFDDDIVLLGDSDDLEKDLRDLGDDRAPSRPSINRWAEQAVRTFLAAYGVAGDRSA
jgi:AcrR family transcriptional regulator